MQLLNDIWTIIVTAEYRGYLLEGFLNTLAITVVAAVMGLIIGFIVAIIKVFAEDNKYLKIPAIICDLYTTVIRGTPVALQLFVMVFAILAIPGFKVAAIIITFGINSGAYVSENIRAGILSIDKGQTEAGRALGLSQVKTMTKIVLPQAIKNVIPSIGNELIALVKETAIVSMVGSTVGTGVLVTVGSTVGTGASVGATVGSAVGVASGVAVAIGVSVGSGSATGVAVGVTSTVGVAVASTAGVAVVS